MYGHAKQGASFGHTKIAGKQVLRKGLSPLATTISTEQGAPVIAGIRLRAGKAGSGKGAASMVAEAIRTARAAGATGEILVRGDSRLRQPRRRPRVPEGRGAVLRRAGQEPRGAPRDRHHPRGRLDAGALPRRRHRSRHRAS